jgi:L-ribulose-5-phosphate 3-epimerase
MNSADGRGPSRRQMLALAGSAAAAMALWPRGGTVFGAEPATAPTSAPVTATARGKRFKVAGDDLFLGNRQSLKAFATAQKSSLDGIQVDMGRMPGGKELINELRKPEVREQFLATSQQTGVEICSLAWFAMYARVFVNLPMALEITQEWVDTMDKMQVKLGFMPLMTKDGTLAEPEHKDVWNQTVEIYRKVAPQAEKAGVILGVESNLDADGYKRFLDAVGSPAVRAFYNPGVGLENKFDVYKDIKDLGKDRVCALHLEQGSVPPEKIEHRLGDGLIDFKKLRDVLLEIGWGGWMSIARSRQKGTETKFAANMTANAKFVHEIFPE